MKVIQILNSDFGVHGTVGMRVFPTAEHFIKNKTSDSDELLIFCRDYNKFYKNKFDVRKILPFGSFFMKVLTAIPIYIHSGLKTESLKQKIFEKFLIKRLKKLNLSDFDIIHSWDYLPDVFKYIKAQNPNIKIVKDMTMAFPNILKYIAKKEKYWMDSKLDIPKYIRDCFENIDYFISPSKNTTESIIGEGFSKGQVLEVSYGVDVKKFKPLKRRKSRGEFNFAFVGNINFRKGVQYLIPAWKEAIQKTDLKINLNLYGKVYTEVLPFLKDSEKFNIFTKGYCDLTKELPKNNFLVHPSLLETTPKSIYEALSCGLPVITTKMSGPPFIGGEAGLIVEEQNIEQLVNSIIYMLENPKEVEKMSKNARDYALKNPIEKYGEKVFRKYLQIFKNK